MFVVSIKKIKLKNIIIAVCFILVLIAGVVIKGSFGGTKNNAVSEKHGEYSLSAKNKEQHLDFLMQFGYSINGDAVIEKDVIIPEEFNAVYEEYNQLQVLQGLDLSKYKGKVAKQYVYEISSIAEHSTQDEAIGSMYGVLLVYRDKVIGGHLENGLEGAQLLTFWGE